MSSFEFTPVDKTVRPPSIERGMRRQRLIELFKREAIKLEEKPHATSAERKSLGKVKEVVADGAPLRVKEKIVALCVSIHFDIPLHEILSRRRFRALIVPRQIIFYLARVRLGKSFPAIALAYGGYDHTTVLHGFEKINGRLEAGDEKLESDILAICRLIDETGEPDGL